MDLLASLGLVASIVSPNSLSAPLHLPQPATLIVLLRVPLLFLPMLGKLVLLTGPSSRSATLHPLPTITTSRWFVLSKIVDELSDTELSDLGLQLAASVETAAGCNSHVHPPRPLPWAAARHRPACQYTAAQHLPCRRGPCCRYQPLPSHATCCRNRRRVFETRSCAAGDREEGGQ
jgi:hypothetical protein